MDAAMSIFGIVFGIIWTGATIAMGAPFFFPLFGLAFIGIGIYNAVFNYKNATSKNRYSEFDIVDSEEESDPLNEKYGCCDTARAAEQERRDSVSDGGFCPYCGTKAEGGYVYCHKCGKKLP